MSAQYAKLAKNPNFESMQKTSRNAKIAKIAINV